VQSENVMHKMGNHIRKYYKPSGQCGKDFFFARFPFFLWIAQYDYKINLIKDFAAGLTVSEIYIFDYSIFG